LGKDGTGKCEPSDRIFQVFPWYASVVPYKASPRPLPPPLRGTLRDPLGGVLAPATIFAWYDVRVVKMHDLNKYIVLLLVHT
jgi:hypothetical protein